jgi:predicted glycosyl hydrolase (DUF1957 family)
LLDRPTSESKPQVVIAALDYFLFGVWWRQRGMDYVQGIDSADLALSPGQQIDLCH